MTHAPSKPTGPHWLSWSLASVLLVSLAGCRTADRSEVLDGDQGPAFTRPGWIKSPEAIEGTITQAWGLPLKNSERWKYLQSMYSMIGGTLVQNTRSLVDQPNELFVMGLDNLSTWLSAKLVQMQIDMATGGESYLFEGLGFATDDVSGCFASDAEDWCDALDGITVTSISAAGLEASALTKDWQKRVMHNIQDIGEFMLLGIDNTLKMPDDDRHAARFLLDEVFVPTLGEGPVTAEKERAAWEAVVHTILMSGGFYLEAPAEAAL